MELINKIKKLRHKFLIKMYSLAPIKKNKIIIWSNSFKSYGCNPKYITEYLLKERAGVYDIVWVVDATLPIPKGIPGGVRIVKYFSKEYLYELHTAHFVICNARTSDSYHWIKRKGQVYIQTWHSSLRLKMIEGDAKEYLPESYINAAKADSEKIDYIISGCSFSSNIFKNSFWYNGEIVECGTPRIDYLLNENRDENLYEKIGITNEYKYILYSPTFRDGDFDYNLDFKRLVNICEEKLGGKWKVLYRLHPNLIFKIKEHKLPEECLDVCRYSDMQELVAVCDMMITDYSSCMFDMMYIKKPCILYLPDYDNYTSNERKLYFDIKKLPFLLTFKEEEIYKAIDCFDREEHNKRNELFLNEIGSFEKGTACIKIAELIDRKREML